MKKVKEEGYSISRGGITYIKKEHEKEKTEQTEQEIEQKTEQTEQETEQLTIKETEQISEIIKEDLYKPISGVYSYLFDEFEQLKTYFRKGNRPSQIKAIENFEKHLKELIK